MSYGRFTVAAADARPVEIRCYVCGASYWFGETNGDVAGLDELTTWADEHRCSRNLRVT